MCRRARYRSPRERFCSGLLKTSTIAAGGLPEAPVGGVQALEHRGHLRTEWAQDQKRPERWEQRGASREIGTRRQPRFGEALAESFGVGE